jgi:AraC-like DNA-binding protein
MKEVQYILKESIRPYVNCIMAGDAKLENGQFKLPLYADGYPGIMFQLSKNGFYLLPKNKQLSELFLYGQTLEPISLEVQGPYKFIVFQLYPFASKYLLGIDPRKLNDECYDLLQITNVDIQLYHQRLIATENINQQIEVISDLIEELIRKNQVVQDDRIQQAIKQIIESEGQLKIKDLRSDVLLTERTLERNFLTQIGLTPKQFAKIIQFQTSLDKLTLANFDKLTHVGLDSGFTDQSHFIRVFKQYTGQTPSFYLKNTK